MNENIQNLLEHLEAISGLDDIAAEFFENNWRNCVELLLDRTDKIELTPLGSPSPTAFDYVIHAPYKRKLGADAPVELMPGPVTGRILYRPDMFIEPEGPTVIVTVDRELGFFHPNHSKEHGGMLCLGDHNNFPPGPVPLDQLLTTSVYPIITFQNYRPVHPADLEAARYFALEPTALDGLRPVATLY